MPCLLKMRTWSKYRPWTYLYRSGILGCFRISLHLRIRLDESLSTRLRGVFLGFTRNRILPIYMLNALLIAIYLLLKMALDIAVERVSVLQSFLFGDTIVENGWYLQACLLFYLFFLWSFKYAKSVSMGIIAMTIFVAVYCATAYYLGLATTWYECSFAIIAGMIARQHIESYNSMSTISRAALLSTIAAIFACTFVLGSGHIVSTDFKIVFKMVSSITFAMTIFFVCSFIPLKGVILEWLGCHYLEIYVLQGVSMLLADRFIGRENAVIYYTVSIAFTLLLAAIAKKPIGGFMSMFKIKNSIVKTS